MTWLPKAARRDLETCRSIGPAMSPLSLYCASVICLPAPAAFGLASWYSSRQTICMAGSTAAPERSNRSARIWSTTSGAYENW